METFAIIDTETNWKNEVMSIGVVLADCETFRAFGAKYYILTPECFVGGMYSGVLKYNGQPSAIEGSRREIMADLKNWLCENGVSAIFAYNAQFDYGHLSELSDFKWYDIIKVAAYRQYNSALPQNAEFCKTGRLKRNYGVQSVMRMMTDDSGYFETHNALYDAVDELKIMQLLNLSFDTYECAAINAK